MTETATGKSAVERFDLASEIREFEQRRPWPSGLSSKTLVKTKELRILLIAMDAGAKMQEHHTDGRICVQVLKGALQMRIQGETLALPQGNLLTLERSVKHDVDATEASVFLLTISWPTEQELRALEHRGYA